MAHGLTLEKNSHDSNIIVVPTGGIINGTKCEMNLHSTWLIRVVLFCINRLTTHIFFQNLQSHMNNLNHLLLHQRFVLTAGHCVEDIPEDKIHLLAVVVGDHDMQDKNEGHESYHPVKTITIHPKYVGHKDWLEWDFAMLELAEEVNFVGVASPICLPSPLDTDFCSETEFTATGWGDDGLEKKRWPLEEVSLTWFDNCKNVRPCEGCGFDEESTICVKGKEGQGTCSGDSGGPLAWYDAEMDRMKLIGVTSYGPEKCGATKPVAFAKVTAALDWIEEIMSGYTFYQDVICDSFN